MKCPECGGDHSLDDKLVTVTLPRMQWEAILSLANISIVSQSPDAPMSARIAAGLEFVNNQEAFLRETAPGFIAIAKVIEVEPQVIEFFQNVLDHVRGQHDH